MSNPHFFFNEQLNWILNCHICTSTLFHLISKSSKFAFISLRLEKTIDGWRQERLFTNSTSDIILKRIFYIEDTPSSPEGYKNTQAPTINPASSIPDIASSHLLHNSSITSFLHSFLHSLLHSSPHTDGTTHSSGNQF